MSSDTVGMVAGIIWLTLLLIRFLAFVAGALLAFCAFLLLVYVIIMSTFTEAPATRTTHQEMSCPL